MQLGRPVSAAEFSSRLDALGAGERFAIAVSGGRDSMALARLSADYATKNNVRIVALIVDHGLREGSAGEAAQAKDWCARAGLETRVLQWRGAKPKSGVQAAARQARYCLLAEAANDLGLPAILTAHSADDQAETFLMRLARGAGPSGLAAMDDEIQIAAGAGDPVRLLRPLLSFGRNALTATAREFDQKFIDDPSNEDMQFERIRARRFLRDAIDAGMLDQPALLKSAARLSATRQQARVLEMRMFRKIGGVFTRWGGASLDVRAQESDDNACGVIASLIGAVGGGEYAPGIEDVAKHISVALDRGAASIGGVLLKRAGDRLWIFREPAAILGRAGVASIDELAIPAGGSAVWDNRFIVRSRDGASVRPLGADSAGIAVPAAAIFEGPQEALASLPGLYCGARLIGVPGLLSGDSGAWSAAPLAEERFSGQIIRFPQRSTADEKAHSAGLS